MLLSIVIIIIIIIIITLLVLAFLSQYYVHIAIFLPYFFFVLSVQCFVFGFFLFCISTVFVPGGPR